MGNENLYKLKLISPIGELWLLSDGESLKEVSFKDRKEFDKFEERDNLDIFIKTKNMLNKYFEGQKVDFSSINISYKVSPFRKEVWKVLQSIPYGKTLTYGEIAKVVEKKLGKKKLSAQAVGGAVGANLFPIIIPCHRVVGKNNNLTGYSGGLDKKIKLLEIEGHNINDLVLPKSKEYQNNKLLY